jgi:predicted HD superfamily hydrolase involved in NAD metabolism
LANKELNQITNDIKDRVSEHRFKHILSVRDTAVKIFNAIQNKLELQDKKQVINNDDFSNKLKLAAILHDSCKELKNEELLELAAFYSIKIFKEDLNCPNLLHARVGAKWIEDQYDIMDPYVLKAVEEHTLGGVDMFLSSKILFLADMIEPLRTSSQDLEELRHMVYQEALIKESLIFAMDRKISYVINKGQKIHPLAIEARNSLIH